MDFLQRVFFPSTEITIQGDWILIHDLSVQALQNIILTQVYRPRLSLRNIDYHLELILRSLQEVEISTGARDWGEDPANVYHLNNFDIEEILPGQLRDSWLCVWLDTTAKGVVGGIDFFPFLSLPRSMNVY